MTDDLRQQRHQALERDAFEALQKDAGIPYSPTKETYDFRLAVSGEGCLAYQWADKPHRLLYDACSIIEREAALRQSQTDALKKARTALEGMALYSGMRESWQDDNPQYVTAVRDAIDVIDAALGQSK